MRSDYALYGVAIIFFVVTAVVVTIQVQQSLWIMTTAVLGLLFIGLGYSLKPKSTAGPNSETVSSPIMSAPSQALATAPPPEPTTFTETINKPSPEQVAQPETLPQPTIGITQVKGIKEKRAQQLRELGVNTIHDLANASPDKLGKDLQISPKITTKWVEQAKQLTEKA